MSTPSSPNNKLQGLAMYAPRHMLERARSRDRAALAEPSAQADAAQPETEEIEVEQHTPEQTGAAEAAECRNEADGAYALDWLDQAIRAVIALEHGSGGPTASDPRVAGPQSPSIAPAEDEQDCWPSSDSAARRQAHDNASVARPPRARLEPEIVPAPPAAMRGSGLFRQCMRILLVMVFAATVAYGLTLISTSKPGVLKGAADRIAGAGSQPTEISAISEPTSRLVVEDQQAFANEPLSLAVRVEHAAENESLLLDGLAQGTTLSAGTPTSPYSWRVSDDELRGLYLYAPKDYVGVMNTAVNLLGADKRLLDSRSMQLKWIARAPKPVPGPGIATATAEATPADHFTKSGLPPVEPMESGEAAMLMQRGREFLSTGDISAARVAFRRLADAGIADAALALANTYDPDYLAAHTVVGVRGDHATARALYQRAKELGSAEAGRVLARMDMN